MAQPLDHHALQQQQHQLLHSHGLVSSLLAGAGGPPPPLPPLHAPQASTSTAPPPAPAPPAPPLEHKSASDEDGSQLSQSQLKKQPAKLFRCTGFGECQMTFTRSEHLARHVRKHTGERPFKCHCGREFSRLDNVRQHAATVHSEQAERNAQTIADLVALHNQLSVSTQQRQKDAGMVLQDGPTADKGSARRRADGEVKPKKVTAKKKQTAAEKKAREQAEAAEQALERQRAAEQEAAAAAAAQQQQQPQVHSSPGQQHQQQQPMQPYGGAYGAAPYPVARPSQPAPAVGGAYPSFAPPPQYPSSAPPPPSFGNYPQSAYVQYTSQLAAHQQLYAAGMAPPPPPPHNLPYGDMYGGAPFAAAGYGPPGPVASPAAHPYAPPPPPSPPAGQRSEPVGLSHQNPSSSGRYDLPGSLSYPPVSAPQLADAGQLTPNKISLPSISALLPSPFANGQQAQPQAQPQQPQQQHQQQHFQHAQHQQQRDVNSQQHVVSAAGLEPHAAAQQQQQRQQAHYAALSSSQGRPPAQSPTAASPHLQQHGMQQGYSAYPPAELQYPPHPGMAVSHPYDPYARPGSTTGSERECPPSLSNGSSSTASSFQAGSPLHPHVIAPHMPGAQQHYSHLYNPTAAPPHSAYQYAPPQPQQPHAYPYASAQYLAAAQQPYGVAQGMYAPAPHKYASMQQPLGALAGPYGQVQSQGGRESSERGA
ncbi:hypothetical protein JCM9279_006863 [Rhodotorula babjevae]